MHGELGGEAGPCASPPCPYLAANVRPGAGVYTRKSELNHEQQFHGQQQQFQRTRTTVFRRQFRQMEAIIAQRTPFGRHVAISHTEGTTQLCHPWTTNCGEGKQTSDSVHWLFIWFGACPSNPVTAACFATSFRCLTATSSTWVETHKARAAASTTPRCPAPPMLPRCLSVMP